MSVQKVVTLPKNPVVQTWAVTGWVHGMIGLILSFINIVRSLTWSTYQSDSSDELDNKKNPINSKPTK